MNEEILKLIHLVNPKTVVDCTYGGGNHTQLCLNNQIKVFAFDRDESIIPIKHENLIFENRKVSTIEQPADLWIADLGMSDKQLNEGFSFMIDNPLDMRMSKNEKDKLSNILHRMPEYRIAEIIKNFGEEKLYKKIARNIVNFRSRKKIETTFELREAIEIDDFSLLARVFQAFRIFINDELEELDKLLVNIEKYAKNAGIITFHSLEDRKVKHSFKKFKGKYFLPDESDKKARSAKLRYFVSQENFLQN
jgi:16S rRNA (cytosine1402-N4)-methyltransferase